MQEQARGSPSRLFLNASMGMTSLFPGTSLSGMLIDWLKAGGAEDAKESLCNLPETRLLVDDVVLQLMLNLNI